MVPPYSLLIHQPKAVHARPVGPLFRPRTTGHQHNIGLVVARTTIPVVAQVVRFFQRLEVRELIPLNYKRYDPVLFPGASSRLAGPLDDISETKRPLSHSLPFSSCRA